MKKYLILVVAVVSFSALSACKKERTCSCTETYTGAINNYQTVTDSIIVGEKEEDAIAICDKGDRPKQTILTESYEIECELK